MEVDKEEVGELNKVSKDFNWAECFTVCFVAFLIFLSILLFMGEPDIKDSIQWLIQSYINDGIGPYRTPLLTK